MPRRSFLNFYAESVEACRQSVLSAIPREEILLDYGCADGELTMRFAERAGASKVLGVEVHERLAAAAAGRGIEVVAPVDGRLPIDDGSVGAATANQLIEHLADTDAFVREMRRVLRPGGTLVVSTNNLSSWHNIAALVLGAQPFPSDVSSNPSIGKLIRAPQGAQTFQDSFASWTHLRVFSYRALLEMMRAHGFVVKHIVGVGYYPLSGRWAMAMARLDPRHSAYLTVCCIKPEPA